MKKKLFVICMSLLSMLNLSAVEPVAVIPNLPVVSTPGNDVWYYIKTTSRQADASRCWMTGAANDALFTVVNFLNDDSQRWKVVANGDGVALVNKKFGNYINTDAAKDTRIYATGTMSSIPLQLLPSNQIPGGVSLLNKTATYDANYNVTAGTTTFSLYGAGAGYDFNFINALGYDNTIIHSHFLFYTDKELLKATIDEAKNLIAATSIGQNPGQYPLAAVEGLELTIEDAEGVYNDAAATQSALLAEVSSLNLIIADFKKQIVLPKLSTPEDPIWYYIQGTRPVNTYLTAGAAGAGEVIAQSTVIPDATQLWRFVANGDGFALKNKATGEYIEANETDNTMLHSVVDMPTKAIKFKVSNETTNKASRFFFEGYDASNAVNLRFHAGNGGLMNWKGNANDNCTWLILSESELFRATCAEALVNARKNYEANKNNVGTEFGQFTQENLDAYLAVILKGEALDLLTLTHDELIAAKKVLDDATAAFKCNSDVSLLAPLTKVKYFRIVNRMLPANGYAAGKAISIHGRDLGGKFTFEQIKPSSDSTLFKFELSDDGKKVVNIQNKVSGYYMGKDGSVVSDPLVNATFEITALDPVTFWIKPNGMDPLHAAAYNTEIVNWNSGANTASAWQIEFVKEEDVTDYSAVYLKTRTSVRTTLDLAKPVSGVEFGQYSDESMTALNNVVVAEEAKNVANLTNEQMLSGILAMRSAVTNLKVNTSISLLASRPWNTRWFRLVNDQAGQGYASGMAMTSNGRMFSSLEPEQFTYETVNTADGQDAQLFTFEINATADTIISIKNKAGEYYVSASGTIINAPTANDKFEIIQLEGGRSFWIHPTYVDHTDPANPYRYAPLHAAYQNSDIVNWESGVGSASAWIFQYVKSETTAVNDVNAFDYIVRVNNRIITVVGVEYFEVYSVLGQRQNVKAALTPGVYVVKVKQSLKKIVVN